MDPLELVRRLHDTPHRTVIEFAGAGAQALAWLHAVGGSSRTVLEATDRYAAASLRGALDFEPERATSRRVAEGLARHAARRARELVAADDDPAVAALPTFGLASTATIATDRTKKGEHRAVVAVRDPFGVSSWELGLTKGARDRAGEEDVVSRLILRAAAEASGLLDPFPPGLLEGEALSPSFTPVRELAALAGGGRDSLRLEPGGSWRRDAKRDLAILSGSFHPLHDGHRELRSVAANHLGIPEARAVFELAVRNADKGGIGPRETRRRASQFLGYAPLLLSSEPLFGGKAALYPGSVFVVGVDTAARVVAERFYDGPAGRAAALERIREHRCRFLVAGRTARGDPGGGFRTLADLDIPDGFEDLFEALPTEVFRRDISSSQLRRGWNSAAN